MAATNAVQAALRNRSREALLQGIGALVFGQKNIYISLEEFVKLVKQRRCGKVVGGYLHHKFAITLFKSEDVCPESGIKRTAARQIGTVIFKSLPSAPG